jgi:hypothetical protein
MVAKNPYDAVSNVVKRFGLNEHFVLLLLTEDDWSYIVKAHTLAEAAITHAIVKHIGKDGVQDFVAELPMSRRLKLAESLSLLSRECVNGTRQLSTLRNLLAHDVSQVSFTFDSYLQDEDRRNSFFGIYLDGVIGTIEITGKSIDKKKFFRENPKWAVNECLFNLMLDVYVVETKADVREERDKLTERLFRVAEQSRESTSRIASRIG